MTSQRGIQLNRSITMSLKKVWTETRPMLFEVNINDKKRTIAHCLLCNVVPAVRTLVWIKQNWLEYVNILHHCEPRCYHGGWVFRDTYHT